jgi:transposase, IS5 family
LLSVGTGHNAPPEHRFKVYTAGQWRRIAAQIKREFKRRAAIEPVIRHLKYDHRLGRNYLAYAGSDAVNVVLAAAGYNFRRLSDQPGARLQAGVLGTP